jgi:hypothetical protein
MRMMTLAAIGMCVVDVGLLIAMWAFATWAGYASSAFEPQMGNHGAWRRIEPLSTFNNAGLLIALLAVPVSMIGSLGERSTRSVLVAAASITLVVIWMSHLYLFD